jgi:hypothetical protein
VQGKSALGGLFFFLCFRVLPAQELGGDLVLEAYQHTYPEKVRAVTWSDGDWTIQVGTEIFYWAQGRLLPPDLRDDWESYRPHGFYPYPQDIPPPEAFSPEQIERLRVQGSAETRPGKEDPHLAFQASLYGGLTRREIEQRLVKTVFLGRSLTVHASIVEALKRIDRVISETARGDAETAAFIASIDALGGYNWREIRGTQRMSYHSWGLAVDIQPKSLGNKAIYWQWEQARSEDWMLVPLDRRWKPPDPVIRAFENEGFTWGGKWALYDNMHFEFRPELHEINRLIAARAGTAGITKSETGADLHHLYPRTVPEYRPGPAGRLIQAIGAFFSSISRRFNTKNF